MFLLNQNMSFLKINGNKLTLLVPNYLIIVLCQ